MKLKILLLSLIFSSAALAEYCDKAGCIAKVSVLYTTADGVIYIGTPFDERLANCTPESGVYFSLNPAAKNAKEMYASILAAHTTNRPIQLRVKEGTAGCELAYVVLSVDHS